MISTPGVNRAEAWSAPLTLDQFRTKLNAWGKQGIPFLFIIDFELKKPVAVPLESVDATQILFNINGFTNAAETTVSADEPVTLTPQPITLEQYRPRFDHVYDRLCYGDSFLTNLTIKTPITPSQSLQSLYYKSRARYKLWLNDQNLVFSPETFVRINDGKIYAHPMKGTIDATIPDAKSKILADVKELAEHVTIVDLIRNDLSQVATEVNVTRFRYVERLETTHKALLQVSSEIQGNLPTGYTGMLGDILLKLLPAGSVSGAPKAKTLEIIAHAEKEERGYYTGVFGYFDGQALDSGVMIRYIEKTENGYAYRSGGGITTQSVVTAEYNEAIDKVYVPVD